ncbi:hypothetical protein [Nonomuraea candida]|uniref:hypothetical protein n=1 Tax=Nonomuraea candida TaxID=359159 RepID=UPI0005BBCE20|nr:hypothetical protein [Nonomuraea candida]
MNTSPRAVTIAARLPAAHGAGVVTTRGYAHAGGSWRPRTDARDPRARAYGTGAVLPGEPEAAARAWRGEEDVPVRAGPRGHADGRGVP